MADDRVRARESEEERAARRARMAARAAARAVSQAAEQAPTLTSEERMFTALSQAREQGHRMTQAYDNGNDYLLARCVECGMLALASDRLISGTALHNRCTIEERRAAEEARALRAAQAKERAIRQAWLVQQEREASLDTAAQSSRDGINETSGAICEYCGRGTTLVGNSCRHCSNARTEETPLRRGKRAAMQKSRSGAPIGSGLKIYDGKRWIQRSIKRASDNAHMLVAPCGTHHEAAVAYMPEDWDGEQAPDILLAFPCHHECMTVRYAPRVAEGTEE